MEAILIVVALAFAAWMWFVISNDRALTAAQRRYQGSLAALKKAPTNPDLKQEALALGRVYSNLTRSRKGTTLFDEVALMNDINAACASATHAPRVNEPVAVETRLRTLADLRDKGLIGTAEFDQRRVEILSSI